MKIFKKIKSNKAATMTDVITGVLIMIIFTGILTTSFYQIYKHNISIRMNAVAVDYAIKVLENIDKISYEEVDNSLNDSLKESYNFNDNYTVALNVKNYNEDDETRQDVIKIVTVTINYTVLGEKQTYEISRVKIKEM